MPAQPSSSESLALSRPASPPSAWRRLARLFPASQTVSLLVLAVSLLTTYQLWKDAHDQAELTMRADFDFLVRDTNRRIEQRMMTYEQVLRGVVALFAADGNVTRQEFRAYFDALRLAENYPGIQGIAFAQLVPPDQKDKHIARVRAEGFPNFTIAPPGERAVYSSIVYIEPFTGRNLNAFGYDMLTEPMRRAAMEQARDTGAAAMSGKVTLIQDKDRGTESGFLMYLPLYQNPGAAANSLPENVAQRRARLTGWIGAPFRMSDLMAGLIGEQSGNIGMEIYDGAQITPETLLYATQAPNAADRQRAPLIAANKLNILGRDWTVVTRALPDFELRAVHDKAPLILRSGIGASVLLTLLAWLLVDDRTRAWQIARLAFYDTLTGLPNRKLFTDRLQQAMAKARRDKTLVAVMFIDLDKFKPVNDRFGHAIGDLLLKEVARRLQSCVRESDTVARLGGDEFIMLFSYSEEKRSHMVVAEKILHALNAPFHIGVHSHHISASIGIAIYPLDGLDEKALLKNADTAMYHAKKSGRNNVKLFHTELEQAPQEA
jgi:diguanylate cyclase (GGDEF)-like protein